MAYKRKEKPGVLIYWTAFDAIEAMVDGDAKKMMSAIRRYAQYGEEPDFSESPSLRMAWVFMRDFIDRDDSKYRELCEKNSRNGKKSAEMRRGEVGSLDNER